MQDRALRAYADITKMAADDKKHGGRITTDVLGSLVSRVNGGPTPIAGRKASWVPDKRVRQQRLC